MQTITRRQFVATSVVSLAAAKRLAAATLETNHKFTPGCQIFGVRHQLVADFDGTLKQLYEAGYRVIEYCSPPGFTWDKAGLGTLTKLTAKETRSRIEAAGLRAVSCHYQYPELKKHLDERIEFAEELGLAEGDYLSSFQSRFGREEWLKPYTEDTVEKLASEGVKNMLVITPGFSSDCVETLEEIAIGVKETFEENGGENFSVVPCLNDSRSSIKLLKHLIDRELRGWV